MSQVSIIAGAINSHRYWLGPRVGVGWTAVKLTFKALSFCPAQRKNWALKGRFGLNLWSNLNYYMCRSRHIYILRIEYERRREIIICYIHIH